jgi:hypothetical protein
MKLLFFLALVALCAALPPRTRPRPRPIVKPRASDANVPAVSRLSAQVIASNSASLEQRFKAAGLVWGAPLYLRATKYSDAKFKIYRDTMLGLRGPQAQDSARKRALNINWYTDASLVSSLFVRIGSKTVSDSVF